MKIQIYIAVNTLCSVWCVQYKIGAILTRWWYWITPSERITVVSFETCTYRVVVGDCALCVDSTRSWTWVPTFLINASQIQSAL